MRRVLGTVVLTNCGVPHIQRPHATGGDVDKRSPERTSSIGPLYDVIMSFQQFVALSLRQLFRMREYLFECVAELVVEPLDFTTESR